MINPLKEYYYEMIIPYYDDVIVPYWNDLKDYFDDFREKIAWKLNKKF